jgi:hypothetical protein
MSYQIHRGEVTAELTHPSHADIKVTVRKLRRLDLITQYAASDSLTAPAKIQASLDLLAQQIVKVDGISEENGAPAPTGTQEERRTLLAALFEAEDLDIPRVIPGKDGQPDTTVPIAFPIWLIEKVSDGATFGIDPSGKGSAAQ